MLKRLNNYYYYPTLRSKDCQIPVFNHVQSNRHPNLLAMTCLLGCFIFSPFLKLKMLGVVSDGVFDADFEYVIFILL